MTRRGNRINVDWETLSHPNFTWEQANTEVLMDIRRELHDLNLLLRCPNVMRGFMAMATIERRLAKRYPLRARRKL